MKLADVVSKVRGVAAQVVAVAKTVGVNWKPVRKVAISTLAAGIAWVALRLGVNLGTNGANEAAVVIIGAIAGWLVPSSKK